MSSRTKRVRHLSLLAAVVLLLFLPGELEASETLEPAELPVRGGTWQFENFRTRSMGAGTYMKAFGLRGWDWLDPVVGIVYLAGKWTVGRNGNCFGMGLLVDRAAANGTLGVPYGGDLVEPLWNNYDTRTRNLTRNINVYQWRQMSVGHMRAWIDQSTRSPGQQARRIDRDSEAGRVGYICISDDFSGHVLVPYGVLSGGRDRGVERQIIYVYDPNRPRTRAGTGGGAYNQIVVRGENEWSYEMGSGTWSNRNGRLNYIRYDWNALYRRLPRSIGDCILILAGTDTQIEQVTDDAGRKLFRRPNPTSVVDFDTSSRGLGTAITRMLTYNDEPKRPGRLRPPGRKVEVEERLDPQVQKLIQIAQKKYAPRYTGELQCYVVFRDKLGRDTGLTINARSKTAGREAVVMLEGNGHLMEVRVPSAGRAIAQPEIRINTTASLAQGIRLRQRGAAATRASVSYGRLQAERGLLDIQHVGNLALGQHAVQVKTARGQLAVQGRQVGTKLMLRRETIGADGKIAPHAAKEIQVQQLGARKRAVR